MFGVLFKIMEKVCTFFIKTRQLSDADKKISQEFVMNMGVHSIEEDDQKGLYYIILRLYGEGHIMNPNLLHNFFISFGDIVERKVIELGTMVEIHIVSQCKASLLSVSYNDGVEYEVPLGQAAIELEDFIHKNENPFIQ